MLRALPFPAWTMSEMADHPLCEKFEANVFSKRRCQNCFRTVAAHQPGNQELEESVKIPDCVAGTNESGPCDPWDPLCILVPQCELYVCVEDISESWQESLEYTQLSSKAEKESEESATCPNTTTTTIPDVETDTNATLSRDWEMTRLLDHILGSDKGDIMYYAGQKHEVRPENVHSERPKWAETASSGRTESWSCRKADSRAMSQEHGDSRRKDQTESGYFSLERRKSEPNWASSQPRVGCSTLPVRSDTVGASGRPASSISSPDSDRSLRTSGSSDGRHSLMRQEYTVLADLPKPKRLNHRQAFEKERSSSRTRSPGRAEVERIFGQERRKSETLEAFQALEEGLLERLDSKSLKLAKEGRLVRRKSSPTLRREVNKRLPWEPEQPSRTKEALRLGRPEQRPERSSRSQGEPLRSGRPTQRPERESQSRGVSPHSVATPPQRMERDRRKREEPVHHPRSSAERGPLRATGHAKPTDSSRKSQVETFRDKSSGKGTETKWKSCLEALHTAGPSKSLDKGQASHQRQLERYKESDRKARGKPLLPVGTAEQLARDTRDCRESVRALSPGRGPALAERGGRALSPPQLHREAGWGAQGESRHSLSPGRDTGISLKSHGEAAGALSPGRCASRSQREIGRSLSPGRCGERSRNSSGEARCSPCPGRPREVSHLCPKQMRCCSVSEQHPEYSWKIPREASSQTPRNSTDGDWLGQGEPLNPFSPRKEHDCKGCGQSFCRASLPVAEQKRTGQGDPPHSWRSENSQPSHEGSLCHITPMQLLQRDWISQRESTPSAKAGQQQLDANWKNQGSPVGWVEDAWATQERGPSPARPEKQVEDEWDEDKKLFYQHQLDGGQPLKSACPLRSQDLYLDTSKKREMLY